MWQKVKLVAFLCCLVPAVTIVLGLALPKRAHPPAREMTTAELRAMHARSNGPDWRALVPVLLSVAGAVVLAVDAFRREYEGPKALPVAIAIVGVLSLGLLSIIYYAIWGWMPLGRDARRANTFCADCIGETTDRAAPGTFTLNGLFGTRLIGRASVCAVCGSSVKTLWLTFLLPLLPFGSYRVLTVGTPSYDQAWYLSRRLPGIRWSQVLPLLLLAAAFVGVVAYVARSD